MLAGWHQRRGSRRCLPVGVRHRQLRVRTPHATLLARIALRLRGDHVDVAAPTDLTAEVGG
jgi:hypothetical protein